MTPILLTSLLLAPPAAIDTSEVQPRTAAGIHYLQRDGHSGYRIEARHWLSSEANRLGFAAEWNHGGPWGDGNPQASWQQVAGTGRYRIGTDYWGIWPLAGWRGALGGLHGPELGGGAEIGFGPGTAFLSAEGGAVYGLNGHWGGGLRVSSRYRVLRPVELEASYRLENWGSWSQVWGLGAHAVF